MSSSGDGLGEAVTLRLGVGGANVALAAPREQAIAELAQRIGGAAVSNDILEEASIEEVMARAGPIDILVNAARRLTKRRQTRQPALHLA